MNNEDIIYSLNINDIQTVAEEEIGRTLSKKEIDKIRDSIAEKISWYNAIADSINQYLIDKKTTHEKNTVTKKVTSSGMIL